MAAAEGGRHPLWKRCEAPTPSWMVVWALGRQQTRQKHMQMYAKHKHACTLYGRRLHPTKIMDLLNLQGVQTRLCGAGNIECISSSWAPLCLSCTMLLSSRGAIAACCIFSWRLSSICLARSEPGGGRSSLVSTLPRMPWTIEWHGVVLTL